jgi:hypothetical protein
MRLPKLRTAAFSMAVLLDVILLAALSTVLLDRRKPRENRAAQPTPATKSRPAKVDSNVRRRVTREPYELRVRIVDAAEKTPIGLARVVIDNGNLAPELGDNSGAVAWPDGRAIIRHNVFVWEERRGDQRSQRRIFQGPWIHVSADGYEPRKMPLAELPERAAVSQGSFGEAVVTLERRKAAGIDLAELAGEYTFGDGFIYRHLEVRLPDRYHFQWQSDFRTNEPHDDDRYESRGRCSVVEGILRLVPEGPYASDLRDLMRDDFVPVRWAGRRYLIPEKERLVFCSVVNQGGVPEYMRSGPFSLREVDRQKPPDGEPEVPREWAPFLLRKPVTGTITEVLENQVAMVDVGAKDGVKAGMEFVRDSPWPHSRIKVLFTDLDRCWVRIGTPEVGALPDSSLEPTALMMGLGPLDRPLGVGENVSSRSPKPSRGS